MADNSLKNFKLNTLPSNRFTKEQINREPGRWIKPGMQVDVGGKIINKGFIYFGRELKSLDGHFIESSLINPDLSVDFTSPDNNGSLMGYWPNYSTIYLECRGAYINWLSGDRNDQSINIGYVFLYFYGLERRIILDSQTETISNNEFNMLIEELYRLKEVYGSNSSFKLHITSLISYSLTLFPHCFIQERDKVLFVRSKKIPAILKYIIADKISRGKNIDEELSFNWLITNPDYKLKTPATRCFDEFKALFMIRFKKTYPKGLSIAANKSKLKILYTPSSASLKTYPVKTFDLPDITRLKSSTNRIMEVAEDCISSLEAYSRYIGRGGSVNYIEAITNLPIDLNRDIKNIHFNEFKTFINKEITNSNCICTIQSLLNISTVNQLDKTDKAKFKILEELLNSAGYASVPNKRLYGTIPDIDSVVSLYPKENSDQLKPSAYLNLKITLLHSIFYYLKSHIEPEKKQYLKNHINSDDKLQHWEQKSLICYLDWLIFVSKKIKSIKTQIDKLSQVNRIQVGKTLVEMECFPGKLPDKDVEEIKKFYTKLGLSREMALEEISSHNLFSLDHNLLKKHVKDTKEVQEILHTIFVDDIDEPGKNPDADIISGLDSAHLTLYTKLVTQNEWIIDDVIQICKELGLMINGAIEVINEWAFDLVDAPLIEEDDCIYIDYEILEEITLTIKQEVM